ncbi:ImmA/IrrE family metallo-endopeptidase [Bacillus tequilensis]|uniref:ImmA/IrrE family metallo-endopeptidase n=1 Tax=Bacillus tequilensis TaxID=227866 RepID=UPI0015751C6A|nr:ImmA/IrrE family metallo-endopeptidase [Bacillus tequilensis]NTU28292.1 ImmA/IrrE family metallo-endopeptidase [Bacillus tequilensis]
MINELIKKLRDGYSRYKYTPEKLANNVLKTYFNGEPPKFPINIFNMLKDFGVFYEFRDLDKLEGAYLPDSDELEAAVLINKNRPYARQRFTTAHELCHHIKDYDQDILCPKNSKDPKEQYANGFAARLLMPRKYFIMEADKLANEDGYVEPEDAFSLCHIFGTSYESVMWNLYNFGKLSFHLDKDFFTRIRVTERLGNIGHREFLRDIINDYKYFPSEKNTHLWLKIQHELVFNDSRLEGLDVNLEEVAELLTDFRLKGKESKYYEKFQDGDRCEVIGHSFMYDMIKNKRLKEVPDRTGLLDLHKTLFCLSPHADEMGVFRKIDNMISGASIQTSPYLRIEQDIYFVCKDIEKLLNEKIEKDDKEEEMSISDYVSKVTRIHHELTKIHPFEDGNGRIIRAFSNWLLKLKNLPPIYIPYEAKSEYVDALQKADENWDFEDLDAFFYKRLLESFIILNEEFSLVFEEDYELQQTS